MGNVLTQKFPAPAFVAETKLRFAPLREGERAGLAVVGTRYGWIGLRKDADAVRLVQNDVVLKDIDAASFYLNGVSKFKISGGDWGPCRNTSTGSQTNEAVDGFSNSKIDANPANLNITIQDAVFHD